MSAVLLLLSVGILLSGGLLCAAFCKHGVLVNCLGPWVSLWGAIPALLAVGHVFLTGEEASFHVPWSVPFGSFSIAMDGLSAFFVLIIAVICALAAVYGGEYLKAYLGRKNLGVVWFFYNLLFASMLMVVVSRNGILFLVSWELMSLASFFLVMFEHERPEVREAGWTYMVAMHFGVAFLFAMFVLLGFQNRTMDFDQFVRPTSHMADVLFILAVVGFGTKAGFLPLHVWLPEAHPAAPSHVSAVMSGVMIKTGIYGLVRVVMFLGPPPTWWGWTLIFLGAASGIVGVMFALVQRDMKRLLAYSSMENIGIICLGLGLWLLGTSTGHAEIAMLGLLGGLLHVWNHAIFKSLLFLGTGAVVHATGTRDLEQLGGLLKRMRYTGPAFLIGAAAICGLPPLNGFLSEFLIYVSALTGVAKTGASQTAVAGLVVVGSLAMIGGLAVACFTKVFGIAFLGEPRSEQARHAHESARPMWVPLWILATLCVVMGLCGPWVVAGASHFLIAKNVSLMGKGDLVAGGSLASVQTILLYVSLVGVLFIALAVGLWNLRRRLQAGRPIERQVTWDCGYARPSARMQYTGSSFAWPILRMFLWLMRPRTHYRKSPGYFPKHIVFESHIEDLFCRYVYRPVIGGVCWVAGRLLWLQQGRNQLYVLYIALTLLVLLLVSLG